MRQIYRRANTRIGAGAQRGGLTVFTAILVLILMTLLMIYATRSSLFETRVSANEVRQKEAFHVAEAALDQGIMYLLANARLVLSSQVDKFSDGVGFTRDGWLAAGNVHWQLCSSRTSAAPVPHPCDDTASDNDNNGGEDANAYFYDTDDNADTLEDFFSSNLINTIDFPAGTTARMTAILCFIDLEDTDGSCAGLPTGEIAEAEASLVLTILSYGYSDCEDRDASGVIENDEIPFCNGEATVAQPLSNYKKLAGSPAVPFVTRATFPPNGTAEIVGNPNGGGVGVPLTTWINENPACSPATPIVTSGTWQTCEMQEWYHVPEYPEGVECTDNNCYCGPGGNDPEYFLSGVGFTAAQCSGTILGSDTCVGIDIIVDPGFPCDLFEFYFGVPRSQYYIIKNQAQVLSDCSTLGPHSSGLIWISGSTCHINANTVIGSPGNPVILISAASWTKLNGGADIFGIFYAFDGEDSTAFLEAVGRNTIYGSCIVDVPDLDKVQGNFQVVYAEGVLADASGIAGIGAVNGGWRDFGLPDITWPVVGGP
jgi:hypothetical protein